MGSHSMGEKCGSRHGADAEGDPERDEKPKLKRKLVQLEATSPHLETGCFPPQSKRATTRRYHVKQRNKLWSVEPSSLSAPRRRPVVVLKILSEQEIRTALCPVVTMSTTTMIMYMLSVTSTWITMAMMSSTDRGLATGWGSSTEDSWKGKASACARDTGSLLRISAKDNKAKIKSKSVTVERQNGEQSDAPHNGKATVHHGKNIQKPLTHMYCQQRKEAVHDCHDAPTSAEPQSCEIAVSSVSKPCTPIASPMSLAHDFDEVIFFFSILVWTVWGGGLQVQGEP